MSSRKKLRKVLEPLSLSLRPARMNLFVKNRLSLGPSALTWRGALILTKEVTRKVLFDFEGGDEGMVSAKNTKVAQT
jgi:hypothetical protein